MPVTPLKLSGSANGRGIQVQSITAASGTLLHTSVTSGAASVFDQVYVYVVNLTTTAKKVVLNCGGTTSGDRIRTTINSASQGALLLLPGLRYNGGVTVRAYATAASRVVAHGWVNRKT